MKAATPQEIEAAIQNMPEWRKQRLTEALLTIARNHGLLDEGPQEQEPEPAVAMAAGGAQ
jgi:hypothetical protein